MLPKPIEVSLSVWGWISQWEGGDRGLGPRSHCGFLLQSEEVAGCQGPCSLGFPVPAELTSLVSRQRERSYYGRGHVWSLESGREGRGVLVLQAYVFKESFINKPLCKLPCYSPGLPPTGQIHRWGQGDRTGGLHSTSQEIGKVPDGSSEQVRVLPTSTPTLHPTHAQKEQFNLENLREAREKG